MATDKNILAKGVKYLSGALPLLFLGPIIINSAFKNKNHPLYPYILALGIIIALAAMFLILIRPQARASIGTKAWSSGPV